MIAGASWGATAPERAVVLGCDELMPHALVRLHRAVSIDAPPEIAFRWLCQLKQAPYSYDLIDNFARRSPRELTPGAEQLAVGQRFMTIFALVSFIPDEQITLRSHRTAVSYAVIPSGRSTRVLARVLFEAPGGRLGAASIGRVLALADLLMMRKQLLTLKAFAEREASASR
jgi:hypothetical protein